MWGPGFLADSVPLVQEDILQDPFPANPACLPCRLQARTYRLTINVPIAYMARDGIIFLMRANPLQGPTPPMSRVMDLPPSKSSSLSVI